MNRERIDLTDAALRERALHTTTEWFHAGLLDAMPEENIGLFADRLADRDIALRDAALAAQREDFETFASHLTGCLANEAIARRILGDARVDSGCRIGNYAVQHPECSCGYNAAAIRAGGER